MVKNNVMDLRCRKTQCEYNYKYTCKAKEVCINDKILCATYQKTDKSEPDTSRHIYERAPDYAPQRESKTANIYCKANCLFNNNGCCESNGITVNAIAEKPFCVSFLLGEKRESTKKVVAKGK